MAKKRRLSWVQITGLLMFTIIFPLVSWYYLQQGYNYRLQSLQELQDLGKVTNYQAINQKGDTLQSDNLRGNVLVAGFYPQEEELRTLMKERLTILHDQFDKRNDVRFLVHVPAGSGSPEMVADELEIEDPEQWQVLAVSFSDWKQFAKTAYHWPLDSLTNTYDPGLLALTDTAGVVKNYYHLQENAEMGRLVEHITIVMPRLPERDLEFKRETEK
jgi:hypothetical protein